MCFVELCGLMYIGFSLLLLLMMNEIDECHCMAHESPIRFAYSSETALRSFVKDSEVSRSVATTSISRFSKSSSKLDKSLSSLCPTKYRTSGSVPSICDMMRFERATLSCRRRSHYRNGTVMAMVMVNRWCRWMYQRQNIIKDRFNLPI